MNPLAAWSTACAHINGLALGSTVEALRGLGVLGKLALPQGFRPAPDGQGHLAGALHLLELLGWARRLDTLTFGLTERGRIAAGLASAFAVVPRLLREGRPLLECAEADAPASPGLLDLVEACEGRWGLGRLSAESRSGRVAGEAAVDLASWFRDALDGHLAAPALIAVKALGGPGRVEGMPVRPGSMLDAVARVMRVLGWVRGDDGEGGVRFTPAGHVAIGMAGTYEHTLAYLPMLEQVFETLRGEVAARAQGAEPLREAASKAGDGEAVARTEGEDAGAEPPERHVDRTRDVAVSGEVFSRFVAVPFLEIFLPVFDAEPLAAQPRAIVDLGCGDARMLVALYEAVRERTLRGRQLASFPLEAIGMDYNEAARRAARGTLSSAGVPHRVLAGDINDPARLAVDLAAQGLAPRDCIFVCKSVIHNRPFVPPACRAGGDAASTVHVTPEGRLIPTEDVQQNLLEFFGRWLPLTRPHGLVVAEAHTVDVETAVAHLHQTLAPALEATHLYSHQLLVEMPAYHGAAERAGFTSKARRCLGRAILGHDYMSIDHFVPAG